jgi:hypothetical protein
MDNKVFERAQELQKDIKTIDVCLENLSRIEKANMLIITSEGAEDEDNEITLVGTAKYLATSKIKEVLTEMKETRQKAFTEL